jgi:hypothetical protein
MGNNNNLKIKKNIENNIENNIKASKGEIKFIILGTLESG